MIISTKQVARMSSICIKDLIKVAIEAGKYLPTFLANGTLLVKLWKLFTCIACYVIIKVAKGCVCVRLVRVTLKN